MDKVKLYVIGTPIGNLKDITLRAIETLDSLDVLLCEDSRVTGNLINKYMEMGLLHNKPRYFAVNEFNEQRVVDHVMEMLGGEGKVGLVSDAGMPAVSDPGFRIIRECYTKGITVEVVPGPSAMSSAAAISGVGGEVAVYLGFLPKSSGKAGKILRETANYLNTLGTGKVVMYVSPHRLVKDLAAVKANIGDVRIVVLRELTKLHEERMEGTVTEIEERVKKGIKGEIVLVVEPKLDSDRS